MNYLWVPQNVNRFWQWWCRYDDKFFSISSLPLVMPLANADVSPNQMHQVTLDPVEHVKLTWMVDWPETNVFFQVKNGINEKYSWFAIGFSRRGEFPRTDFCIFQRESERIDVNIVSNKLSLFAIPFLVFRPPRIPFTNWIRFSMPVMSPEWILYSFVGLRWEFVVAHLAYFIHDLMLLRVICHRNRFGIVVHSIRMFPKLCNQSTLITFTFRFKDARSSDDGREIIIDRQQDCISISRSNKDEIAFRRKFDTCDDNDFPFHEGTMFIYWMRGEEPLEFDHTFPTPDLPESDYGMAHLQLLRADSLSIPEKWVWSVSSLCFEFLFRYLRLFCVFMLQYIDGEGYERMLRHVKSF